MNKITKTVITLSAISLLLVGCDLKKDEKTEAKPTTIEEIQKEKGKPARVVKATAAKLSDVRKFSGSIEGMQQSYAISKMGDPLAKINVQVGSSVQKDQVLADCPMKMRRPKRRTIMQLLNLASGVVFSEASK